MTQSLQTSFDSIGVIGAGAWGTALAQTLARGGKRVVLWTRDTEAATTINAKHENTTYLPHIDLDDTIYATSDLDEALAPPLWLLVVPVQYMRAITLQIAQKHPTGTQPIVLCSKGIEQNTLFFPADILQNLLPSHPLAVLSGPTFAREVAQGQPTAVTLACADLALGQQIAESIGSRTFRPYTSTDVIGAEIGGAIKNVLAVACGIAKGCGMEENARAALITRGLAEMMRLGQALGAKRETLMGLSGLGDLTLTCSSTQSRNMSLGLALGRGEKLNVLLSSRKSVAEGVPTAAAAVALAAKHTVDMPITQAVNAILNHNADVQETIAALLSRPWRAEEL